jgi:hypothetical protein
MPDIFGILFTIDKTDTGCRTAFYLILQTWATAIGEEAVFTLPDTKRLLQQVETIPHSSGTGIRAKIASLTPLRTTMQTEPGEQSLDVSHSSHPATTKLASKTRVNLNRLFKGPPKPGANIQIE